MNQSHSLTYDGTMFFRKQMNVTLLWSYKCSYIGGIEEILYDNSKFSNLDTPAGKEINHTVNLEKRISSELKLIKYKEILDKSTYKSIKQAGSRPGILYGSGKIQKETRNRLQS